MVATALNAVIKVDTLYHPIRDLMISSAIIKVHSWPLLRPALGCQFFGVLGPVTMPV